MKNGTYHIHIDATSCSRGFVEALPAGFFEMNFTGHPPGYRHFEPNQHLTFKCKTHAGFLEVWEAACEHAAGDQDFKGYLEGEYIPFDDDLPEKPYVPGVPVPFRIKRRRLRGPEHGEGFRKTEIHLVLDKDRSDPRLIESLLVAGLYGAYLPKTDYTALVLTAQSMSRREVIRLTERLRSYLNEVGGVVHGSIKEEICIANWQQGITVASLPEIIDFVTYL